LPPPAAVATGAPAYLRWPVEFFVIHMATCATSCRAHLVFGWDVVGARPGSCGLPSSGANRHFSLFIIGVRIVVLRRMISAMKESDPGRFFVGPTPGNL
jgi:hypothetical protein